MSFCTTPIEVDKARLLVSGSDGEVVSASKAEYFGNTDWMQFTASAEIKDDSITLFFRLRNSDFVEYCIVKDID